MVHDVMDAQPMTVGGRAFELTLMTTGGEHVWLLVEPGRLVLSGAAPDEAAARGEAEKTAAALVDLAETEDMIAAA